MSLSRAIPVLAMLALLPWAAAHAAMPATLDCTDLYHLNWRASEPLLAETGDAAGNELGGVTLHLDPRGGEWFLAVAGSAALTQDGGRFTIVRDSGFARYYEEWVGVDGDAMLRIRGGGADLRFVFVSRDYGVIGGSCVEPEQAFVFLRDRSQG